MAILRYSKGLARRFYKFEQSWRFRLKLLYGKITNYPVFRPPIDHSLYEADNRLLGSTTRSNAKIIHQMSWSSPILKPVLVEFEHGLALIKPPHQNSDFVQYRQDISYKINSFLNGLSRASTGSAGVLQAQCKAFLTWHTSMEKMCPHGHVRC